jgi:hypothetical protein
VIRTLALDIVGPLVMFRICRRAGVPEVWSLVISGALPALGVLVDWLRWRTLEVVGLIVLVGIALSVALALITSDPKAVLLEGAAITAAFGLACFCSLRLRRPLIFYFGQAFEGGRHSATGAEMEEDYDVYEEARFFWRTVTVVWGITQIVVAASLTAFVLTSSTGRALTFNRTVPWVATAALICWSIWWGERLRAQKPDDGQD